MMMMMMMMMMIIIIIILLKSRRKRDSNPGSSALEADGLTPRLTRRSPVTVQTLRVGQLVEKPDKGRAV